MSKKSIGLSDVLSEYLLAVSLREPDVLKRLRDETSLIPEANMQISPEQGQFMALLVKLFGAVKALEVGVFTGYSSTSVALALPQHGRLVACDVSDTWSWVAKRYWEQAGVAEKIELRPGFALVTLDALIAEGQGDTYDFAFIDADKTNYDGYYERTLQLLRQGGLLLIDNVLWDGRVVDDHVQDADTLAIRSLNRKIHGDSRVAIAMIPIADGLTLALKQ